MNSSWRFGHSTILFGFLPQVFNVFLGALVVDSITSFPEAGVCHAEDYISPELIRVSTPSYRSSAKNFEPPLGTYEYAVSWQGIPAASAVSTVEEENGLLKVSAQARTASGIDIFYKLRYSAEAWLKPIDYTPTKLVIDHQENSKRKQIEVSYSSDGTVTSVRDQPNGKPPVTLSFDPHNMLLEPMSAAFIARGVDWNVGDTKNFDVFNGKSRYLITLTALEKTSISNQGQQVPVFVISPKVRTLTTIKANEKLREARIYLSADERRDVLRIESSVFIGSVTTELEKFTPTVHPDSGVRMARLRSHAVASSNEER